MDDDDHSRRRRPAADDDDDAAPPLIVVADDDEMQRLLLGEALRASGYEVLCVDDGGPAVEAAARLRPALLVLDVVMREVDGFEACRRVRAAPGLARLPILLVTGLDDTASVERAYHEGATDFLPKPINWPLLGHRVRYMLRAARALEEARAGRELLAEAERVARLGSWRWDRAAGRVVCSAGARRLLGLPGGGGGAEGAALPEAALLGRLAPADRARLEAALDAAGDALGDAGGEAAIDCRLLPSSEGGGDPGRVVAVRAAPVAGAGSLVRGTIQDITERHLAEARVHHLAHHDALTGLPNRLLLLERLGAALDAARRGDGGGTVGVLCLDLDRFKEVNDTLGHAAGDDLLRAVARRLGETVRGADTVARLGGDEFVVVQAGVPGAAAVEALAARLLDALARPLPLPSGGGGREIAAGASLGVALFPDHGADPGELLARADTALYSAKAAGRGAWRRFRPDMDERLRVRRDRERLLRAALAGEGLLELHYQPQVALADERMVGVEALLRLRDPSTGALVPPAEFVPIAEETGLIVPIGAWVLRAACAQGAAWRARFGRPVRVAVNLSPVQLRQEGFAALVAEALAESGLPPDLLELEITEGTVMRDTPATLEALGRLRALGVAIAMDDFGTGYSSLGYLRLFPFDRIKIDRSFVEALSHVDGGAAIVRSILDLGRNLGLRTTAEGVETLAQALHLRREACEEVQGFYFGRPMPAAAIEALLDAPEEAPRRLA